MDSGEQLEGERVLSGKTYVTISQDDTLLQLRRPYATVWRSQKNVLQRATYPPVRQITLPVFSTYYKVLEGVSYYHAVSRTALDRLPFGDVEKKVPKTTKERIDYAWPDAAAHFIGLHTNCHAPRGTTKNEKCPPCHPRERGDPGV